MILRRARVRVGGRCDDECPCPSPWTHPIAVAAATVLFQVVGEFVIGRLNPQPERDSKGDE